MDTGHERPQPQDLRGCGRTFYSSKAVPKSSHTPRNADHHGTQPARQLLQRERHPTTLPSQSARKFIFSLNLYIFRLKLHIFKLKLYIFSLKTNFASYAANYCHHDEREHDAQTPQSMATNREKQARKTPPGQGSVKQTMRQWPLSGRCRPTHCQATRTTW